MAEEKMKVAPGCSIVSKGVILNEGEEVTVKNFATEDSFKKLQKVKKIVSESEYISILKKRSDPKAADEKAKKDSGKQGGKDDSGKQGGNEGA